MPRSFLLAAVLSTLWAAAPLRAIEYAELRRYWSRDAQHVPYRAIETPGRRDGERLTGEYVAEANDIRRAVIAERAPDDAR